MADEAPALPTLDDLLRTVRTPQARLDLIQMALGSGWDVPAERLEELLKHLEPVNPSRAASLALQLGQRERALGFYQKAGMRREYAELAEQLGKDDLALRAYQELGDHQKSIALAKKLGRDDLARQLACQQVDSFISSRRFYDALKIAYGLDDRQLVYRIYAANDTPGAYVTAAFAARDFGDMAKRAEFLEKEIARLEQGSAEGRYRDAAWAAEQLGDTERALRFHQLDEMLNPPPAPKPGKEGYVLAAALEAHQKANAGMPRYPRSWYVRTLATCVDGRVPANRAEQDVLTHLEAMEFVGRDGASRYRLTPDGAKALASISH